MPVLRFWAIATMGLLVSTIEYRHAVPRVTMHSMVVFE
jgi:hypothetical protein